MTGRLHRCTEVPFLKRKASILKMIISVARVSQKRFYFTYFGHPVPFLSFTLPLPLSSPGQAGLQPGYFLTQDDNCSPNRPTCYHLMIAPHCQVDRNLILKAGDPRLGLALEKVEPRIHFALNCGAKSCPPIKTFSGPEVQQQLQLATQSYFEVGGRL